MVGGGWSVFSGSMGSKGSGGSMVMSDLESGTGRKVVVEGPLRMVESEVALARDRTIGGRTEDMVVVWGDNGNALEKDPGEERKG